MNARLFQSRGAQLKLDQRPLYVQLYWQREDRDGRFLLKSDADQLTKKLFDDKETDRKPNQRNSKLNKSKRGAKNKENKGAEGDEDSGNIAQALYSAKQESSFTRTKSNPEVVMRMQREKKLEQKMKQLQNQQASGGGGGPLRIFAENLQPENPYKTILCGTNDTTETVLKEALLKFEIPLEEKDQYCLTMVTIAPGNQSDSESSSGVKERVMRNEDCPAGTAASFPESAGELRFYLKRIENLPKSKQPRPVRTSEPRRKPGGRGLAKPRSEQTPLPGKETTFDVIEHSPPEKVRNVILNRDRFTAAPFHDMVKRCER